MKTKKMNLVFYLIVSPNIIQCMDSKLKLINNLNEDNKAMVIRLIDTIVTKKKFKDFVATMQ